jgi:hypothetical protein
VTLAVYMVPPTRRVRANEALLAVAKLVRALRGGITVEAVESV